MDPLEIIPIFAVTTRGLETICAEEINQLPHAAVSTIGYRRVHAQTAAVSISEMLSLTTIDNLFLQIAEWRKVEHTRDMLPRFTDLSKQLPLQKAVKSIQTIRPLPQNPSVSITANFVGKRNYNTQEIKDAIAAGIRDVYHWKYQQEVSSSDLNLRVFIEHQLAYIGAALTTQPLQKRAYKQVHLPGSLKPPVAAALVRLAHTANRARVLDPFCGSGTILIEAAATGCRAVGGDLNPEALNASDENLSNARSSAALHCWNAVNLPFTDFQFDAVITNLPWGGQIQTDIALPALYQKTGAELRRMIRPGGRIVLLADDPAQTKSAMRPLRLLDEIEISLYGRNPHILVFQS
ncbi:MAG: methyltransferase domain-containing protein [Anaerolineaceae bacterium]|nr:methyltransferase domain-containing protein [Anaerolineaceae bacterium]